MCSLKVGRSHLFNQVFKHQFCSCSSYLFLCGLLGQEIVQVALCYFLSKSNQFLFLGFVPFGFQVQFFSHVKSFTTGHL